MLALPQQDSSGRRNECVPGSPPQDGTQKRLSPASTNLREQYNANVVAYLLLVDVGTQANHSIILQEHYKHFFVEVFGILSTLHKYVAAPPLFAWTVQ